MLSQLLRRLLPVVVIVVLALLPGSDALQSVPVPVVSADERGQKAGAPPAGSPPITLITFVRVVDGQSIDALIGGQRVAIALHGISAPQGNTSCGRQATQALQNATRAARARGGLRLVDDPGETLDSRGRRLFYLEDVSGRSIATEMVRAGVARANGKGREAGQLRQDEQFSNGGNRGCLWSGGRQGELHWPPTDGPMVAANDDGFALDTAIEQAASTPAATAPSRSVAVPGEPGAGDAETQPIPETLKAPPVGTGLLPVNILPVGFNDEVVASGINNPTAIAFLPDGRILVATKNGIVNVIKNGVLLSTPFIDLRSRVNDYWDRGMLSIAADPAFASNGYVYLAYTFENDANEYNGSKTSRVVRVTATGDTASPSSEVVILGKQNGRSCKDFPAGADCLPSDFFSHSVGALKFAPDGTLFFTHGEGANFNTVVDEGLRSQDLNSLGGKLIRITTTGSGVPGNPFWNGDPNANRSKIWSLGLRNPYRFNLRPGTTIPYLGDVGWGTWEEINVATAGANFGWPCYENTAQQSGYASKTVCQSLYAQGAGAVKAPLTAWNHNGGGAAVTGGAFYTGSNFPGQYQGAYFYGDYALGFIRSLNVDGNNALTGGPNDFGTASNPVDIEMGPDGTLYYVAIFTGEVRRIRYGPAPPPPPPPAGTHYLSELNWISATSGWGPVEKDKSNGEASANDGSTITINGTQYQKGLGVHASADVRYGLGAACSRFMADVGVDDETGNNGSVVFQVWLDGAKAWDSGTMTGSAAGKPAGGAAGVDLTGKQILQLVVTDNGDGPAYDHADWANARIVCGASGGNTPPVATISGPASTLTYKVGDTIAFAGSATDTQDGAIAPAGLNWTVRLHHCPGGACHTHQVLQQNGVASGMFVAPDEADDNRIEVVLTATDAGGLAHTTSVMLLPQTVQVTLATNPSGLQVVYSGVAGTAPMTQTAIVGSQRTIQAPSPQGSSTFVSWSDGGATSHNVTIGAGNATYTATFSGGPPPPSGTTSYLSDLSWTSATNGWGPVERNRSNGEASANDGGPITLNGATYARGLGVHATSDIRFTLPANCTRFLSDVGVDDEVGAIGSVVFQVWLDGVKAWDSGTMTGATPTQPAGSAAGIDITGKQQLRLVVTDNADGPGYDHGDWADARIVCGSGGGGGNTPPVATISGPSSTLTYKVGDTIAYSGAATDTQDGAIPAANLSWEAKLVRCPGGACASQTISQQSGVASGSFAVPDQQDDSRIEIVLTATDAGGLTGTASVTLMPQTVQITVASSPAGLQVGYNGSTGAAPLTRTAIVGGQRAIDAPSPQSGSTFQAWSDGGAQSHTITVGTSNATYTATYTGGPPPPTGTTRYLSDLPWTSSTNGWGPVERDHSNGEASANDGNTITLNGTPYQKGIGTHATSEVQITLPANCTRLFADVGIDDEVSGPIGSVVFEVWLDGVKAWDSGTMTPSTPTRQVGGSGAGIDITGKQQLRLVVTDNADGAGYDHGDWADARISCN